MRGEEMARIVEAVLAERGIKKGKFYEEAGVTATALYGWKNGAEPKQSTVRAVEEYLGISFADYENMNGMSPETAELLQTLRERKDLQTLLESARELPKSEVYALMADIERRKETNNS